MITLVGVVVAGLLLGFITLRALEHKLIYFPPRFPAGFPSPQTYEGEVEEVWLKTSDGVRLNAFYRSHPSSQQALLLLHGNAENIGYGLGQLRALAKVGVNILAPDYRGTRTPPTITW